MNQQNKKLKAFLLAAGLGTRLKPLTDTLPKCLLPLGGKPLLQHWLENLAAAGVDEVLLNTHWLHDQVDDFLAGWDHSIIKVTTFYEKNLLGSAGTIFANQEWLKDASDLLIVYADNFTDVKVSDLLRFHRSHEMPFTLGIFETTQPKRCGIVELDEYNTVTSFIEKPEHPRTNLAAGGIYVAAPSLFTASPPCQIGAGEPFDLGRHFLPTLVHNMKACLMKGFLVDIGTHESYEHALNIVEEQEKQEASSKAFSEQYIRGLKKALDIFPQNQFNKLIKAFNKTRAAGRTIFVMGNGGSGATASHWVCDINKGCSYGRDKRFRMICLNDNMATVLAYSNDISYDDIFVEQLKNFLDPDDLVVVISGSGNSKNVVKAVEYANSMGAETIGLVGFSGGKLCDLVSIPLHIEVDDMQIVEDVHSVIIHMCMKQLSGGC